MSRPSYEEVLDGLEQRGRIEPEDRNLVEREVRAQHEAQDSVLLSILAGLGAFLATGFGLLFLFLISHDDTVLVISSLVLLAGAVGLDSLWQRASRGAMGQQVVLALSFCAQVGMVIGLASVTRDLEVTLAAGAVFSSIAYVLIAGRTHRFVTALIVAALGGVYLWTLDAKTAYLNGSGIASESGQFAFYVLFLTVVVGLPSAVFGARRWIPTYLLRTLRPAGYAAAFVAAVYSGEWVAEVVAGPVPALQKAVVGVAAATLVAIAYLEDRERRTDWSPVAVAAAIMALGLLTEASLLCSALLVGLGIWRGRRVLAVLGWLALGVHLFVFYTGLDVSTMTRSASLVAGGLVLLGLWWFLRRVLDDDGEQQ